MAKTANYLTLAIVVLIATTGTTSSATTVREEALIGQGQTGATDVAASPDPLALPRVRSSNVSVDALIAQATEQSATFRGLIEAISSSDGIVYVETGECGHEVTACLVTVTVAGAYRMLWIKVDTHKADCDLIVSIGHELQHAVEILTDSDARNGVEMFLYYLRIARRGAGRNFAFETMAAIDAGTAVRSEIQTCRAR